MIQKLARYWMTDYDWRACEANLNALPQFITEIDGLPGDHPLPARLRAATLDAHGPAWPRPRRSSRHCLLIQAQNPLGFGPKS
jgi:hypothetical protein